MSWYYVLDFNICFASIFLSRFNLHFGLRAYAYEQEFSVFVSLGIVKLDPSNLRLAIRKKKGIICTNPYKPASLLWDIGQQIAQMWAILFASIIFIEK